jgi:hypothetical protein
MSLKMNLKFAALLGDEVRHNRVQHLQKNVFLATLQCEN